MTTLIVYLCILGAEPTGPCIELVPVVIETSGFAECEDKRDEAAARVLAGVQATGQRVRLSGTLCTTKRS